MERFEDIGSNDQISVEHRHRYQIASQFVGPDSRVLDLGCGLGYGSRYLCRGVSYLGIDISEDAISYCRQVSDVKNVTFEQFNATSIPLPDSSFDVITAFEMLEHVPDPSTVVKEARRLLKPDGLFLSSTPDRDTYNSLLTEPNLFHVSEMSLAEYVSCLEDHFKFNKIMGQFFLQSSFALELGASIPNTWEDLSESERNPLLPIYLIGVSSSQPINIRIGSTILRSSFSRNLGGELVAAMSHLRHLEALVERSETQLK